MSAMVWRYVWNSNHYYKGLLIIEAVLLQIFMRMLEASGVRVEKA